ncbi:cytochrome P450 [Roridomyces roridus]|uniref:Cytochrome P450 n=1 Tax=Roridomyces roridus TaxID=1738132 RepID=A0AAD7FJY8_9AGAR|nr:cytochrome P450 [Roridomyces roridus]
MSLRVLVTAVVTAVLVARLTRWAYRRRWALALRGLPGPPSPSGIFGHFGTVSFRKFQGWHATYGPTFKYHGMLGEAHLYTADTTALHHIVNNSEVYQKAPLVRYSLIQLVGRGLLALEGEEHTKMRKIMSPAFGVSQIRGLTELFVDKSVELRDVWAQESPNDAGWIQVDVLSGLKRMTLDVIGKAGFAYEFHALNAGDEAPTPLGAAFRELFMTQIGQRPTVVTFLRAKFPLLRYILPGNKRTLNARLTMDKIGFQLLQNAKASIASGDKDTERRDLLSLLVKSNMSEEDSHRLSDAEVIAQLPTFFTAGHETTSTATAWALYALARAPDVQDKLRNELSAMGTDNPSLDALNSLPYLEKFVREVMRVHAPVAFTSRMVMQDDVIPLGRPYTDTRGVSHSSIPVRKGLFIRIPVAVVNQDPWIWGDDAAEFNPDRWDAIPPNASTIPGVYVQLFTFFGGSHNCIGWRFALAEIKALVYTLVRAYEVELAVPVEDVDESLGLIRRPILKSRMGEGPQLPMRLRKI